MDKSNPWYREDDISILEIYDLEQGTREVIQEFDCVIEAPNWSLDGEHLIYNSNGKIYKIHIGSKETTEINSNFVNNCNNDHVLSSDGKEIAVSHGTKEDGKSRIYILPIDGGMPRLITPMAPSYLHGWSPDGKYLSYCAQRDGVFNIYTVPAEGGEEKQLTFEKGLDDGPEYDPTGEYIWFNSVRSGLMQAWRMKADGSEQVQMTFDDEWNTWFPHISPDGEKVVMIAYKKGDLKPDEHLPHKNVELRYMSSQGDNVKTLVSLFGGQGTLNVNSWSPDSKRFAFVSYRIREN